MVQHLRYRDLDRIQPALADPAISTIGRYPPFLHANFPGIRYAICHGSLVYPFEAAGHAASYVPNSPRRLLDLILVIPDDQLPESELAGFQETGQWDIFHPIVRTAAQWHRANRRRHPTHYSGKMRSLEPTRIAKLQSDPKCPILYFPYIELPRAGNQTRSLWCKYGVISESSLVKDLTEWYPFHMAGRLHKAFLTFDRENDMTCHLPPPSLAKSVAVNRIRAIQAALLMLPERFTFGTFLHMLMGLSYIGDIRMPFAEDKRKVTNIIHSQAIPLGQIYLDLLRLVPGFLSAPASLPATVDAVISQNPPEQASKSRTSKGVASSKTAGCGGGKSTSLLAQDKPAVDIASSNDPILSFVRIPSQLVGKSDSESISDEVFIWLSKYSKALAENARDRLVETDSGTNPDRVEPFPQDIRELKAALLSESFIIEQDMSKDVRKQLFDTLPNSLKQAAGAASSSIRFNKLFSPLSLLSHERLQVALGGPIPSADETIRLGLRKLTRRSSISVATKSFRVAGPGKSVQYALAKLGRRFFRR